MDLCEILAVRITELCEERHISINDLSYLSGISNSTIQSIFHKHRKNPVIATIKKLYDGLRQKIK